MKRRSQEALPIVGVMGSGSMADETRAAEVGRWLASEGVHLLTGGGAGAMAAVSRAFAESEDRAGLVIGILPARAAGDPESPPGYPNPWVELPIRTHLHVSGTEGTTPASRTTCPPSSRSFARRSGALLDSGVKRA